MCRDMRRVHRWIYTVVGVYTLCTFLIWRTENGGALYAAVELTDNGDSLQGKTRNTVKTNVDKTLPPNRVLPKTEASKGRGAKCPGLNQPFSTLKDSWQQASGNKVYVYSAYFEPSRNQVVVIGVRDKLAGPVLWCQLWADDGRLEVTRAMQRDMPEGKGRKYVPLCY